MRPFPWIVRVGLFAVGFGAGLSHYGAPSTQRPVLIEIRAANPDIKPAASEHTKSSECPLPSSALEILSASN